MRAILFLLMCSCAQSVSAEPSSLPWVRIDPTLQGPVMSREAAEVVALKRLSDRHEAEKRAIACEADERMFAAETLHYKQIAERNKFWGTWGPTIAIISVPVAILGGVATAAIMIGAQRGR